MKLIRILVVASVVIAVSAFAHAATYFGPTYPAPGGNSFSAVGDPLTPAGLTASYGSFNPVAYSHLWWTITDVANPYDSSFSASTGNMSFGGYSAGVATWNSTSNLSFFDPQLGTDISFPTRFQVSVNGAAYDPVPTTPAWAVTGPYTDDEFYQGWNGLSWTSLGPLYNSFNHICTGGCLNTSEDGGFYYTSATPEPGSMILLGTGLLGLAGAVRCKLL